jgi:multidrug efflux pump subunit AcrA (membrane-fusion protein)
MSSSTKQSGLNGHRWLVAVAIVGVLAAVAWATSSRWLPNAPSNETAQDDQDDHAGHEHAEAEHDHDHPGHSEETSIELSENALRNIGFEPITVALGEFERTISIPAIVVEQPGKTQVHITAPMTGVVTNIYVVRGEAIEPNSPMFDVRLTHEELVTAQRDYLQTAENLDVINREIARLESLGEGVIAGKRIIEQQYEKQKLEANLRAADQALLLHGFSEEQVKNVLASRKLLRSLTISAPAHSHSVEGATKEHLFHVQSLPVSIGEQVEAGQELAVLADHWELLVEGLAFEQDASRLRAATRNDWSVSATLLDNDGGAETIKGLELLYLADRVDPDSRAYRFYLRLPNQVEFVRESEGSRYIEWRFKPGQRMELHVPVERWDERIVLPTQSIVEEGAETYVYRQNGDHFDRVSVHVEYRDRKSAVVANNGSIFPGDVVAGEGAYQMHLAMRNKSGGGVDPHAGHSH